MNGFHDFDDFRVSAWMNEGLMITLATAAMSVSSALKKAVYTAAAGVVVATTLVATVPAAASVPGSDSAATALAVDDNEYVDSELAFLTQQIDAELENLMDFSTSSYPPYSLALAGEAVAALESRKSSVDADWATRMFPA